MDNYDIVFDLIESPHRYTTEEIEEIMSDPEARKIYNILCMTSSAYKASEKILGAEIDEEWKAFTRKAFKPRSRFFWLGNRAASIAVFVLSSLAAVAIGVTITINMVERKQRYTAIPRTQPTSGVNVIANDTIITTSVEMPVEREPILFEDESLENILKAVSENYSIELICRNPDTLKLHLYYKFDPLQPFPEVVEQLNTFEQINMHIEGKTLIVD